MNKYLKMDKAKLPGFLDGLLKEFRVMAPVEDESVILYREIDSAKEAVLDFYNSRRSPKEFFFPQSEVLFSYRYEGKELALEEAADEPKKAVIFGMRPCDVRGVLQLDNVFIAGDPKLEDDLKDAHYSQKREDTTILALGCSSPRSTCFCTSLGGGPCAREGADALFVDVGKSYVIELLSPKGEALFAGSGLPQADEEDQKLVVELTKKAEAAIESRVETEGLSELKLTEIFESPFWDKVHEKCLGCGICTYLCPTCSCFDVVDEKSDSGGERVRIWDTCLFPLYSLQASGFNPRPTGKGRMRQRVLHKYKYALDTYDEISCVGCGRCVVRCPVNLDIRQVVNDLVGGKV